MLRQGQQGQNISSNWPEPRGFGLYVHYPQCLRRCGYCDFETVSLSDFPATRYTDAVLRELRARAPGYQKWPLETVYLGGGSPSLWPSSQLERVLECISELFGRNDAREVTLEINPQDATQHRLDVLRALGVNRLSIGVQSLDDDVLALLTRTHDARQGQRAISRARAAGFENLSCDLICGVPGETIDGHRRQIHALTDLGPEHISIYALTLQPGSQLHREGIRPLEDDPMAELLAAGRDLLERHGYLQYEVSNYASNNRYSEHNALVWQGLPYLGVGASAHSLLIGDSEREQLNVRVANPRYADYVEAEVAGDAVRGAVLERLTGPVARHEMVMLALRTVEGLCRGSFQRRFKTDVLECFGKGIEALRSMGLVSIDQARVAPTRRGIFFADTLALQLLS